MKRYSTEPRAWWPEGEWTHAEIGDGPRSATVFDPDSSPYFSGLYDQFGVRIMGRDYIDPIGFMRFQK